MDELVCARCGGTFPMDQDHTEIVRRDFVGRPRPEKVEYLCGDCWERYVGEFLGAERPASER